jgi:hypothetical protein
MEYYLEDLLALWWNSSSVEMGATGGWTSNIVMIGVCLLIKSSVVMSEVLRRGSSLYQGRCYYYRNTNI